MPPMPLVVYRRSHSKPSPSWSPQEDQILLRARQQNLGWPHISERYFPGKKTPNACRKRHERLKEWQNAEDWDGYKLEALAKTYMDVRKEMWTILGERLGEKWALVEEKVR